MRPAHAFPALLLMLLLSAASGAPPAADAGPDASRLSTDVPSAATPRQPPEPAVQRTHIEDERSRIDELKVRGEVKRITVQPKQGWTTEYEVVPGDGARDMAPGHGSSRGAAGQRVWHVLSF